MFSVCRSLGTRVMTKFVCVVTMVCLGELFLEARNFVQTRFHIGLFSYHTPYHSETPYGI